MSIKLYFSVPLILFILQLPLFALDYPKREIRAVWVSTIYGMDWPTRPATNTTTRIAQQKELCDKLDLLKAANFNVIFLQVRLRGDLIYPSEIEPMSSVFTGRHGLYPGYDPLAFAIEECHKRGLECHAWFVTYPVGTAEHVRVKGNKTIVKTRPDLCKFFNGEWYMDPGLPGTSDYILSLVKEVTTKYDVDGVHFDYIRYPDSGDGFPDGAVYARYGKSMTLRAWREDNINRLVARIYDWVKLHRPWVQVSSSPLGKYSPLASTPNAGQTGLAVYQNTLEWMRQEKQDMIIPMMYYRGNLFYPFVNHWMANKNGRYVVPGLGIYRMLPGDADWSLEEVVAQIEYVRSSKADGLSFFRGSQLFRNYKGVYDALKNKYFKYPALLPPLTWLSSEKPPSPVDLNVMREENLLLLTWMMPAYDESYTYTVYYSRTGSVDTSQSAMILATGLRESEIYLSVDMTKEQEFTFSVTASSRYHIESKPSQDVYYYLSKHVK
jgi:uncharacterized lipoprotein YddW (UPF0748 family)